MVQVCDVLGVVGNITNAFNNSVISNVIGNATDIAANVAEQFNVSAVSDFLANITNKGIDGIDDLLETGNQLPFLQSVLLNPDLFLSTSKDSYVGPYLPNPHCLVSFADTKPNTRSRTWRWQSKISVWRDLVCMLFRMLNRITGDAQVLCVLSPV